MYLAPSASSGQSNQKDCLEGNVFECRKVQYNRKKPYIREMWSYDQADYISLTESLENAPWNVLDTFDCIDDATDYFSVLFTDTCKQYIPVKNIKVRPKDKPWMTSEVRKKFKIRDRLHSKWKKSKTLENYNKYKEARHLSNFMKMTAKTNYNSRIYEQLKNS